MKYINFGAKIGLKYEKWMKYIKFGSKIGLKYAKSRQNTDEIRMKYG